MARRGPHNPERDYLANKRAEMAVRLHIEGKTFAEIGAALGISANGAYKAWQRQARNIPQQTQEEMRMWILGQQYRALAALNAGIESGDTDSIKTMCTIHQRMASMFGLDLPAVDPIGSQPIRREYIIEALPAASFPIANNATPAADGAVVLDAPVAEGSDDVSEIEIEVAP